MLLIESVQDLPMIFKRCVEEGKLSSALSAIVRTIEEALTMMTEVFYNIGILVYYKITIGESVQTRQERSATENARRFHHSRRLRDFEVSQIFAFLAMAEGFFFQV